MHEPAEVPQESGDDGAPAAGQATSFAQMQPTCAVGTADSSAAALSCRDTLLLAGRLAPVAALLAAQPPVQPAAHPR